MEGLHAWLAARRVRVSGKSASVEATRNTLRHWRGVVLFLEDGRVELGNNTLEEKMTPGDPRPPVPRGVPREPQWASG
jgi:transposase